MVSNLDQVSAYVTSEGQVDVSAFEDDFMWFILFECFCDVLLCFL
jgi:hypothetical protein